MRVMPDHHDLREASTASLAAVAAIVRGQRPRVHRDDGAGDHGLGKLWMPGAEGVGPYSGRETLSLLAWMGSWVGLHDGPLVFDGVAKLVAGH